MLDVHALRVELAIPCAHLQAVPDPRTKATLPLPSYQQEGPPPFFLFFLDLTLEQKLIYKADLPLQGEFYSHPHQFSILSSPATRSTTTVLPYLHQRTKEPC